MTRRNFSPLFLLCIIGISSISFCPQPLQAQDACTTYTENYTCPAEPARRVRESFNINEIPSCSENLVEATLSLMEFGNEEIELTEGEEAVMLIGTTGTGKTTLTYFLAGDNSKLISYKKDIGIYLIKDCHGKISGNSTIVSATIFPELLVEPSTNTAFYDNPGFQDTRDICTEIASAYFIRKIADHVRRLKFILVINEPSIQPGFSRVDLINMLNAVIKFLPQVEKYGKGLGLIGTKLKFDVGEVNENGYIQRAKTFLRDNRDSLQDVTFDDPDGVRKAQFIVDTLIDPNESNRIGLFRMPMGCGPMTELEHMQSNKQNMTQMIHESLEFVNSSPDDFGYSLSPAAALAIYEISLELSQRTKDSLMNLNSILNLTKLQEFSSLGVYGKKDKLTTFISQLKGAVTGLENELESGSIKTDIFITKLLDKFVDLGLAPETAQNYSSNLVFPFQFFDSVGYPSFVDSRDAEAWLKPLTTVQNQMVMEQKWNELLINLWRDLTDIEYQSKNKGSIKEWWQNGNKKITLPTFSSFWDRFNITSAIYSRDKEEFTGILETDTVNKLKNLNDLLSTSLDNSFNCILSSSKTISTVTGSFVTFSDFFSKSCFVTGVTKTVTVFANHTIYVDHDFNAVEINGADNIDLTLISPTLWYSATNMINLDGTAGLHGDLPGGHGESGGPGKPGGKAGNLISMAQFFPGTIRNSAKGGKGGNGATGEKGEDGTDGDRKELFSSTYPEKDECEAERGKIELGSYYTPYWCDDPQKDGWCHADDEGAIVIIEGLPGNPGKSGGNGGKSGVGGKGGHLYTLQALESGLKEDKLEVDGPDGAMGVGGQGGVGGQHGDEIWAQIDDVSRNGEKWCKVIEQQHQGGGSQARDGNTGITGGNPTSPQSPIPQNFNSSLVSTYFEEYKKSAFWVEDNQFLNSVISDFKYKGDQIIQKF